MEERRVGKYCKLSGPGFGLTCNVCRALAKRQPELQENAVLGLLGFCTQPLLAASEKHGGSWQDQRPSWKTLELRWGVGDGVGED